MGADFTGSCHRIKRSSSCEIGIIDSDTQSPHCTKRPCRNVWTGGMRVGKKNKASCHSTGPSQS